MSDLIIFDLDNTIIKGDSDRNWGEFLSEEGVVDKDYRKKSELFYGNYHDGNLDIDELRKKLKFKIYCCSVIFVVHIWIKWMQRHKRYYFFWKFFI